jgi:hypothetical protein
MEEEEEEEEEDIFNFTDNIKVMFPLCLTK